MEGLRQHCGAVRNRGRRKLADCDRYVREDRCVDNALGFAHGDIRPRRLARPCISHQQAAGCCQLPAPFLLGHTLGVAVSALDGVDVVELQRFERGIHLFHIQTTIRRPRTRRERARGARVSHVAAARAAHRAAEDRGRDGRGHPCSRQRARSRAGEAPRARARRRAAPDAHDRGALHTPARALAGRRGRQAPLLGRLPRPRRVVRGPAAVLIRRCGRSARRTRRAACAGRGRTAAGA